MIKKSLLIWLAIIPLAILNGGLREIVFNPLIGERYAQPLSGVLLCIILFVVCWFCIPRIGRGTCAERSRSTAKTYWIIGIWWVILTVLFETCFGLLTGDTLAELIRAYDITTGNLWLLVILCTGIAPWLTAKTRKLI